MTLRPRRRDAVGWRVRCVLLLAISVQGVAAQSLSNVQPLSFGTLAVTGAGDVSVGTTGLRITTGGVVPLSQGEAAAPARFVVTGTPQTTFSISLPADPSVVLSDGAGHSLPIQQWTSNLGSLPVLGANGQAAFQLGATLKLQGTPAPGRYSGTFQLTVNYQ